MSRTRSFEGRVCVLRTPQGCWQGLESDREVLAGSIGVSPPRAEALKPALHAIGISSSIPFVAQPALGRTDEELRHEALGYGQALLGLSHACHKQKISLTIELFREEAAKAIDDRAAGVLRDHEA